MRHHDLPQYVDDVEFRPQLGQPSLVEIVHYLSIRHFAKPKPYFLKERANDLCEGVLKSKDMLDPFSYKLHMVFAEDLWGSTIVGSESVKTLDRVLLYTVYS